MFNYTQCQTLSYDSFSELYEQSLFEERFTERIPAIALLNADIRDDREFVTKSGTRLVLNDRSIKAFCGLFGIHLPTINRIERSGLASEIVDEAINSERNNSLVRNTDLIINKVTNQICGLVSKKYRFYSNKSFLDDLLRNDCDRFDFVKGVSVNTKLNVQLLSKHHVGRISGKGGQGADESELGIQLRNSMVGDSSLNPEYFLRRKVCQNGMICDTGGAARKIYHRGNTSFFDRLVSQMGGLMAEIDVMDRMINDLSAIPFDPHALASIGSVDNIIELFPDERGVYRTMKDSKTFQPGRDTAHWISSLPRKYGGETSLAVFESVWRDHANMFDFVNVATEYAHRLSDYDAMELQRTAGKFSKFVLDRKTRLIEASSDRKSVRICHVA